MMQEYYPAAIWRPGPAVTTWPEVNAVAGVICHSMQGRLDVALAMLADPARQVSWHFSVAKEGTIFQHYLLTDSPWHAGSHAQNVRLIGIEHAGGPPGNLSEPLTEEQAAASVVLVRWIAAQGGWAPSREPAPARTLWEHNEVSATFCPSGRIDWALYEEAQVETVPLNFNRTLKLAEEFFRDFSDIAIDQHENAAHQIVGGYAIPAGKEAYIIVVDAGRVP